MKSGQSPTMSSYIFWRIFPLAVLVMSLYGFSLHKAVSHSVRVELQDSLAWQNRLAVDILDQRLRSLIQQVEGLADNRFVREYLRAGTERSVDIQAYFRALNIAGSPGAKIALVDVNGNKIATNSDDLIAYHTHSNWRQTLYFGETYFHLDEHGLIVAVPVMEVGEPRGAVLVEYSLADLVTIFEIESIQTPLALVDDSGFVIYASNPMLETVIKTALKGGAVDENWALSSMPVPQDKHLRLYVVELAPLSISHVGRLRHYLLITFLVNLLAIVAGVALTAWMGTRELKKLTEHIGRISSTEDLDRRVEVSGPAELQQLGNRFNDMLATLKRTSLSREYFDNIIRSLDEILIVVHPRGNILTMNPAARSFLQERGLSDVSPLQKVLGRNCLNPRDIENFVTAESDHPTIELHYSIEGEGLYLAWTRTQLLGPDGLVAGIIYTARDITASRVAERARLESEERLNLAVRGTQDGVWDWRITDGYVYYAPRLRELLRLPEGKKFAPEWKSLTNLLHREDNQRFIEALNAHLDFQEPFMVECRLFCADGEYRWFLVRGEAIRDQADKPVRMAGSISDITERKAHEVELEQFKIMLESSRDMIAMIDPASLRFTFVNEGTVKSLGYTLDEMLEMGPWDLKPGTTKAQYREFVRPFLEGEEQFRNYETRYMCKNGDFLDVEVLLQAVRHDDGSCMLVGIARDLTERRRIDRIKSEFISTVSHELRTPLTSIMGSLGLIRGGAFGEMPDEMQDMVEIAYMNSDRLVALINDILDIEKLESGSMTFVPEELDVMELVEASLRENKGFADRFGVSLAIGRRVKGARLMADSMRLRQVMTNLISNAVKFSPEGEEVEVSAMRRKGRVRISISDKGPGIPKDFEDRIFGKFAQADSSDTRQITGTGLGLSICKAIIEKQGGVIDFKSKSGKGATFYFEMPELDYEGDKDRKAAAQKKADKKAGKKSDKKAKEKTAS